jgi:hypothetical protein
VRRRRRKDSGSPDTAGVSRRQQVLGAATARDQAAYDATAANAERIQNLPDVLENKQTLCELVYEWASELGLTVEDELEPVYAIEGYGSRRCRVTFVASDGDLRESFIASLYINEFDGAPSVSVHLAGATQYGYAERTIRTIEDLGYSLRDLEHNRSRERHDW